MRLSEKMGAGLKTVAPAASTTCFYEAGNDRAADRLPVMRRMFPPSAALVPENLTPGFPTSPHQYRWNIHAAWDRERFYPLRQVGLLRSASSHASAEFLYSARRVCCYAKEGMKPYRLRGASPLSELTPQSAVIQVVTLLSLPADVTGH